MKSDKAEKVIETSPIRLTTDETRAIMKAATAGKPISDYRCCGLVDLGIMRLVQFEPKDHAMDIKHCWTNIQRASLKEDEHAINTEFHKLHELAEEARNKEKGYVLTDLGKQVARGVKVSLNGQFKQVPC